MKTDKNSPESDRVDDLETEQDDAIIAVALRWSLRIVLVVAAISVLAVWLFRDRDEIERVEEATLKAPASLPGSSTPTIPDLPFVDVTGTAGIGFVHRNGATGDRLLPETDPPGRQIIIGLGAFLELLRQAGATVDDALFVIDLPDLGGAQKLRDASVEVSTLMEFEGD